MEDGKPDVTPIFSTLTLQIIIDFWELPASKHTDALANNIERNFYLRCSEEKRPFYLRGATSAPENSNDKESRQPKDAAREVYDESLFKGIFNTFKKRIFWSSVLLLVSGKPYIFLLAETAAQPFG
jgi:hypothetical protein